MKKFVNLAKGKGWKSTNNTGGRSDKLANTFQRTVYNSNKSFASNYLKVTFPPKPNNIFQQQVPLPSKPFYPDTRSVARPFAFGQPLGHPLMTSRFPKKHSKLDPTIVVDDLEIWEYENNVRSVKSKPWVTDITIPGGGGKGNALLGTLGPLRKAGILDQVHVLNGASVGAITAAIMSAGLTDKEIEAVAEKIPDALLQGKSMPRIIASRALGGDGIDTGELAGVLKNAIATSMIRHITEFKESLDYAHLPTEASQDTKASQDSDTPTKGEIDATLKRPWECGESDTPTKEEIDAILERLSEGGEPTFGDGRTLHKVIPLIKEVSLTVTAIATKKDTGKAEPHDARLYKISADTYPNAPISKAVCASAAFPKVIKPADVPLGKDDKGREIVITCQDGGVMNNIPDPVTFGVNETRNGKRQLRRRLNGAITMVFTGDGPDPSSEDETRRLLSQRSGIADLLVDAPHALQKLLVNLSLQTRQGEIAKIKLPPPFDSIRGTLTFKQDADTQQRLRSAGAKSISEHIAKSQTPTTRVFDSEGEMLYGLDEVDLLKLTDAPGDIGRRAEQALEFRKAVETEVRRIAALVKSMGVNGGDARAANAVWLRYCRLEASCGDDASRCEFVAIELNSYPELDDAIALLRQVKSRREQKQAPTSLLMQRTLAWGSQIDARKRAERLLNTSIAPELVSDDLDELTRSVMEIAAIKLSRLEDEEALDAVLTVLQKHFEQTELGFCTWFRPSDGDPYRIMNEGANQTLLDNIARARKPGDNETI